MKKFLALLLAVLMLASMSVTAFATEVTDKVEGEKTGTVEVQIVDEDGNVVESTGTYKVTIAWGNLVFKIQVDNADEDIKWDGDIYTITNGKWDHTSADVTVTNYSDMPIVVNGLFDNDKTHSENVEGVSADITGGQQNLASAVGAATAPVASYTVSISDPAPTKVSQLNFDVDVVELTIKTA